MCITESVALNQILTSYAESSLGRVCKHSFFLLSNFLKSLLLFSDKAEILRPRSLDAGLRWGYVGRVAINGIRDKRSRKAELQKARLFFCLPM